MKDLLANNGFKIVQEPVSSPHADSGAKSREIGLSHPGLALQLRIPEIRSWIGSPEPASIP